MNTGNGNGNGYQNGNGNGHSSSWWRSLLSRSHRPAQDVTAFRRLALQLHYDLPRENGSRSALLLTPTPCRLSANGALGLAYSLGEELRHPVLLVDACPSRPEISGLLSCSDLPGWTNLLQEPERDWQSTVLPTSSECVRFLPAGTARNNPPAPDETQRRLKAAEQQYDFVLLFGGAVLDDLTGLALVPHVACVLLLVSEDETLTEDLRAAQEALALCKARNVRLVLTSPAHGQLTFRDTNQTQPRAYRAAGSGLASQ